MYNKEAHEEAVKRALQITSMINPLLCGQNPAIFQEPRPPDVVWGEPFYYLERRCHRIVYEALQPLIPLKIDRIMDVTEGIGAGFSGMGEVCGAVSGAIMAYGIDLASRYHDSVILRLLASIATQKFMRRVIEEFGSVRCRDIIGHDLSHFLEPGDKKWEAFTKDEAAVRRCGAIQRFAILNPLPSEEDDYLDLAYGETILKK